ncbi:glycosyltransferase family 4 protein [Pelagibacteraceae bacterium]|jgi:glycosyltransferase involved in cell wall biosynthesis|nr:glycosyltransferase family 4 protein [Pelagibacteraceae bacterium]
MTTKIKVLQVIPKLGYGGAETGCYDLAHFLAEQNCKSFLITSGGELLKFIRRDKVKIIRLPVQSKNPIIMFINSIIIFLIIIIYNIDIVHARSRAPAWSCLWACFFSRKKFVTTFHGTYNFSGRLKHFYNSIMVRSKLIIAGSNFIFEHISKNYSKYLNPKKKKLMVVFRGINLEYFNLKNTSEKKVRSLATTWNIDTNNFIILIPGRLTRWKGQEIFIESLNLLLKENPKKNFHAIILGSNQGRHLYSKKLLLLVEQHRLRKKISFIENCKEMPVAYKLADVVVSSSIEPEAFGRVTVEAQAMSKPIVASDIGGSRETILNGKSGILYNSNDPKELAKAIGKIMNLDKDSLSLMGEAGRKNVEKKFNVDQMCQTTFTEYNKLLK